MDNIPQEHKDLLRSNPDEFTKFFDEKYGIGSAQRVLTQMDSEAEIDANKRGVVSDVATQVIANQRTSMGTPII